VEGRAYFVYILSAESINQRSFLAATHGTRFALHRSGERLHNLLMFLFCHAKGFYQVAHVAGRRVPRRRSPRPARLFSGGFHSPVVGQTGGPQPEHSSFRLPRFRRTHRSRIFVLSLIACRYTL